MSADSIREILKRVVEIQPLPLAVTKLFELTNNIESSVKEVTSILSCDQALSAKVLKIANSPLYGCSNKIATVSHAIVILGFSGLRELVVGVAMQEATLGSSSQERQDLWKHSLVTACLARQISNALKTEDPETVFLAGLLHDIGKVIFIECYPDEYKAVLNEAKKSCIPVHKAEKDYFKLNHSEIGSELCKHWQLPALLIRPVAYHHYKLEAATDENKADDLIRIIQAANELSKIVTMNESETAIIDSTFIQSFKKGGLGIKDLQDILVKSADAFKEVSSSFGSNDEILSRRVRKTSLALAIDIRDDPGLASILQLIGYMKGCSITNRDNMEFAAGKVCCISNVPQIRVVHGIGENVKFVNSSEFQKRNTNVNGNYINIKKLSDWFDQKIETEPLESAE